MFSQSPALQFVVFGSIPSGRTSHTGLSQKAPFTAYAPSIGHPARLSGQEGVLRHVTRFRESVDNFRFFNLKLYPFADAEGAVPISAKS